MDDRGPIPWTLTDPGAPGPVPLDLCPAEKQLLAQRYEVRGWIGAGGTATVHEAYDRELHRTVALKVLHRRRTDPGGLARLRREVAAAHDAESPHLVRVFDLGQDGDVAFLTMERVDGTSLRERLEHGPLPEAEAVRVAAYVLRALAALHAVGIVHRDVKPGNVLLSSDGTVKLADFGLVVRTDSSDTRLTATEGLVGTPDYLSPEQALGKQLDGRSDLYSLGLVLFEMLAGSVPFRKETPIASALARLHAPAPDLAILRRGTPRWLAAFVARLLERAPARRYPSASAALADLAAHRATRAPRAVGRPARLTLAGLVLAAAAVAGRQWRQSRFDRLVASDAHDRPGIRALDRAGRILWDRPDMVPGINATLAHVAGPGDVVAAVLGGSAGPGALRPGDPRRSGLSVLDRQSGRLLSETRLPDGSGAFPGFPNSYGIAGLAPVDLDGDGLDELVLVFVHDPYWPSYTIVHEPRSRSSRVVFLGSGHHRFQDAVDVDGDGRKELILAGPNNRMGMMTGIAAVRVPPRPFTREQEQAPPPRCRSRPTRPG